jgi:hypothetical protein
MAVADPEAWVRNDDALDAASEACRVHDGAQS